MTDIWADVSELKMALKKWPHIFGEEFATGLELIAEIAVGETVELAPHGSGAGPWGHLSNSIQRGEPVPTGSGWQIAYGTPAEYGEVMEHGRKPGSRMPPIEAIANWVWDKRYIFPDVQTEEDAVAVAFPIARAIAKKGFSSASEGSGKGWKMFEKGMKATMPQAEKILIQVRDRIAQRCMEAV